MTHPPNKLPTDHKVVKHLTKFENEFNVLLAYARNHPDGHARHEDENALYAALEVARRYANEAQSRLDQKAIDRGDVIVDLGTTPEVLQERFERLYHADENLIEAAEGFEESYDDDYDEDGTDLASMIELGAPVKVFKVETRIHGIEIEDE